MSGDHRSERELLEDQLAILDRHKSQTDRAYHCAKLDVIGKIYATSRYGGIEPLSDLEQEHVEALVWQLVEDQVQNHDQYPTFNLLLPKNIEDNAVWLTQSIERMSFIDWAGAVKHEYPNQFSQVVSKIEAEVRKQERKLSTRVSRTIKDVIESHSHQR